MPTNHGPCGAACVEHLRGMFGFAIWDTRTREMLLARDRLGIKPLYYAERNGELLFASELKPILQIDGVDPVYMTLSPEEIFGLMDECERIGLKRFVITHALESRFPIGAKDLIKLRPQGGCCSC